MEILQCITCVAGTLFERNIGKAVHFVILIIKNCQLRTRKYKVNLWIFFGHSNRGKATSKQTILLPCLLPTETL